MPDVHPTTLAIYGRLEEFRRDADARLGYPLLRWLSLLGDQAGEISDLFDRIDVLPVEDGGDPDATSALTDPTAADAAWLPWLAQFVGVQLDESMTEAEQRDAVRYASSGLRAGTKTGVAAAAKTVLTGGKYAKVYDHAVPNAGGTLDPGSQWDVTIVTRTSETPDPALVLATVVAKGAKPVGDVLHHQPYSATWAQIEAAFPTWADIEAAGTWRAVEEAGIGG